MSSSGSSGKRPNLSVEVPQEAQGSPRGLDPAPSKGKYSPGTILNKTASFFDRTMELVTSKAPQQARKAWDKALTRRMSVNPIEKAAGDARYRTSVMVNENSTEQGFADATVRVIHFAPRADPPPPPPAIAVTNKVITSKYNVVTFLPVFLFEMFSRVAYLYFLIQAGLSWWSVISPYSGVGATAALLFVLLVAGIKAVWEDVKRHQEDERMNTSVTHKMNSDGTMTDIPWTEVRVGDALMVKDDELFPADIVCLQSNLADNVCFIKTTNLDGETNLKIRKPLDYRGPNDHHS